MSHLHWQKSSFSGEASNCVNIAMAPDGTLRLRESDEPEVVLKARASRTHGLLIAIKSGCLPG
ncbi:MULTISPECIES: DUF397 domain-containing protein [Streptomyces]|jgi:hypothetical protein|uniref:DUF397 domain-containing protein n=1 Tax=Streptomyces TaxID=1883 RepID=UPI0019085BB1|nr:MULTISPECIES: DUF397 domain-containing protein [unclassified Streptomyces]MCU4745253.1 DUF397 domain-containing protein [Streptomyces sp. G-5]QQN79807.1 DUF397 domain-containing protein [Streptomyces sp. XC 2026]